MARSDQGINPSECIGSFSLSSGRKVRYYSLKRLEKLGFKEISRLPFSIRIILESLLRNMDGRAIKEEDVRILAEWNPKSPENRDIPLKVSRILMQDFTGVPAVVDLASMRDFVAKAGSDANVIQPMIPVDLIIDHSVQVDAFNVINALEINQKKEIERNHERYHLLKWAHYAFSGFKVFPPSAGICHQVNLEYLATCVSMIPGKDGYLAFPDVLVGTDSHTTMINGLGVIGFGVGGIEAEAAMLGEPENTERYIEDALGKREKIMGFGHRVYKTYDPRARIIRSALEELQNSSSPEVRKLTEIALREEKMMIEKLGRSKGIWPNVDLFSGPVYTSIGIAPDLFTPLFAVSRIPGWCAHMLEYWEHDRLLRPLESYTGPLDIRYVPIGKRS